MFLAYARFDGLPGDCTRNGQRWITIEGFARAYPKPQQQYGAGGGYGTRTPADLIIDVRGLTAASAFAQAALTGRYIPTAEIALVNTQGQQYLLIRMQQVIITSVTTTARPADPTFFGGPGQRVEVSYGKIYWTFTPVTQQDHLPQVIYRLRRT